jgi:hypothetical protein
MDRIELPLDPHHLAIPSSVAKKIFMPMVDSVQIVQLSDVEINTISKQIEASFHLTYIT